MNKFYNNSTIIITQFSLLLFAHFVNGFTGGIVMQPDVYGIMGRTDNMIHELGHIFGLLHVHHGVSELDCEDPCFEKEPTSTLGDLCADTNPTPTNTQCEDPEEDVRQCGFGPYAETPYRNFMSYASKAFNGILAKLKQ